MINISILFALSFLIFFYFLNFISDKKLFLICCFFCAVRIFDNPFGVSFPFSFFIPIIFYCKFFLALNSKFIYITELFNRFKFLFFFLAFEFFISLLIAFFFYPNSDYSLGVLILSCLKNFIRLVLIILFIKYVIDNKKFLKFGFSTILLATLISISTEIYTFIFGYNLQPIISNFSYTYDLSSGLKSFRLTGLSFEPRYMSFLCGFCILTILVYLKYKKKLPNKLELSYLILYSLSLLFTFSLSGYIFIFLTFCSFLFAYKKFFISHIKTIIFLFGFLMTIIYFTYIFYPTFFWQFSARANLIEFYDFKYFPTFFNIFEHHDKLAITLLDSNPLFLLNGMGYSMIRFFDANLEYAKIGEPSLTRINFPEVSDCCDPGSGLILCLSSFGIFATLFFIYKLFSYIAKDNRNIWAYISLLFFLNLPPGPLTFLVISLAILNYKLSDLYL